MRINVGDRWERTRGPDGCGEELYCGVGVAPGLGRGVEMLGLAPEGVAMMDDVVDRKESNEGPVNCL